MAILVSVLLSAALLTGGQAPDAREVMRKALANEDRNDKAAEDYAYRERIVTRHLDANGKVTKTEIKTNDVVMIEGTPSRRLVAKDDKPLPPDEERKEQARIDKETEKRKNESPSERQKRLDKYKKGKQEEEEFNHEIVDAFDFKIAGHEEVSGIPCVVFDAAPRPDYKPKKKEAGILKHFTGRVWVTEETSDLVKFDARVIDDISFGWFLAKLNKGAHVVFEMTRVNDEVWLPRSLSIQLNARALVKKLNIEQDQSFSDYKKFRVDSRVTGIAEPKP